MNKSVYLILTFTLFSLACKAGFPPTATKGAGDTSFLTTFNIDFDKIPLVHNGTNTTVGTIPATQGGTGQSVYVIGDLLYASTTTALSKLNAGFTGTVLTSNGAGNAPSWQAISAANTSLSNLASTAVSADINPATTGTVSLGTSVLYWLNAFFTNLTINGNINADQINPTTPREIGNLFAFQRVRAARFSPDLTTYTFTGNFTSGSASVTNVSPAMPASLNGGNYVMYAAGFTTRSNGSAIVTPITFLLSFSGTTITMNNQSLATGTAVSFTVAPAFLGRSENGSTIHSGTSQITTGSTTTAPSGQTNILTGATTTGQSGDIIINSGASSSGGRTGTIFLSSGGTSGTRGNITLIDGTQGTTGHVWASKDTAGTGNWQSIRSLTVQPNTVTFLSGSGTYTPSTNTKWIRVKAIGGGGSPTVSGVGVGNAGGNTTFGTILTAGGGAGSSGQFGGTGGTCTLTGVTGISTTGGGGGSGGFAVNGTGGQGGSGVYGGAGIGGASGVSNGSSGATNTGGGGGGNANAAAAGSGGGGSGAYCEVLVSAATLSYSVGAGGTALSGGSAGGSGQIIIEEYFQ